jgi:NAD(P)-dependent dehydrogenase (short-subunit alcohol dehydrogenase family)
MSIHSIPLTLGQDVGVAVDCVRLVKETVQQLGGLDIIVNNAGWTRFAKFGDLNDLSHEEWDKVGAARLALPASADLPSAGAQTSCLSCA